jgi:sterol desaturase/sphingolipid hydroxylase (fatty acid hydroxylase superfamily)
MHKCLSKVEEEEIVLKNLLFTVFCVLLLFFLIIEFLISKHPIFPWEEWPGFNAVFGFVAFVVLIFTAKYILRPIVKRKEDYYD